MIRERVRAFVEPEDLSFHMSGFSSFSPLSPKADRRRLSSPPRSGGRLSSGSTASSPSTRRLSDPLTYDHDRNELYSDRFIPSRITSNLEDAFEGYMTENLATEPAHSSSSSGGGDQVQNNQNMINSMLRSELLGLPYSPPRISDTTAKDSSATGAGSGPGSGASQMNSPNRSVLKFRSSTSSGNRIDSIGSSSAIGSTAVGSPARATHRLNSSLNMSPYSSSPAGIVGGGGAGARRPPRKISRIPYKVLDAPSLQDDYYLNLLDWSSTNVVAVALGTSVYLFSAFTSKVTKLCDLGANDTVTSISWALHGSQLAIGANTGQIHIWDAAKGQKIRQMASHASRVGTLAWNSTMLASGSRDRSIYIQDIRLRSVGAGTLSSSGSGSGGRGLYSRGTREREEEEDRADTVRQRVSSSLAAMVAAGDSDAAATADSVVAASILTRSRDRVVRDVSSITATSGRIRDITGGRGAGRIRGRYPWSSWSSSRRGGGDGIGDVEPDGDDDNNDDDDDGDGDGALADQSMIQDDDDDIDDSAGVGSGFVPPSFGSSIFDAVQPFNIGGGAVRIRTASGGSGSLFNTESSSSDVVDYEEEGEGEEEGEEGQWEEDSVPMRSHGEEWRSSSYGTETGTGTGGTSPPSSSRIRSRHTSRASSLSSTADIDINAGLAAASLARTASGSSGGGGGSGDRDAQWRAAAAAVGIDSDSAGGGSGGLGRSLFGAGDDDTGGDTLPGRRGSVPSPWAAPPPLPLPLPPSIPTPGQRPATARSRTGSTSIVTTMSSSSYTTTAATDTVEGGGGGGGSQSIIAELSAHRQEVCGLRWSPDERMLASGGNDNRLYIWSPLYGGAGNSSTSGAGAGVAGSSTSGSSSGSGSGSGSRGVNIGNSSGNGLRSGSGSIDSNPICRFDDHTAAVKAVGWSPHQHGLIASGGGTADRHIRFWNCLTSTPLHRIDTGSQVCNLMWSRNVNEIVSTHGYSLNQVIVWKYPTMQKLATLTGHSMRVLYLAMSPDGQTVVTGAGDETLRFWNIFPGPRNGVGARVGPSTLLPTGADIR